MPGSLFPLTNGYRLITFTLRNYAQHHPHPYYARIGSPDPLTLAAVLRNDIDKRNPSVMMLPTLSQHVK